jgi:hypothetical protein
MTTITIDRELLEQALVALSAPNHCVFSEPPICVDIRAALAAPAHQEQLKPGECWPERIMTQWDEMRDLIAEGDKSSRPRDWFESLAEMRLIDAPAAEPAWHDAPTCAGVWICDEGDICYTWTANNIEILDQFDPGEGLRWYGPIPPDGDKP